MHIILSICPKSSVRTCSSLCQCIRCAARNARGCARTAARIGTKGRAIARWKKLIRVWRFLEIFWKNQNQNKEFIRATSTETKIIQGPAGPPPQPSRTAQCELDRMPELPQFASAASRLSVLRHVRGRRGHRDRRETEAWPMIRSARELKGLVKSPAQSCRSNQTLYFAPTQGAVTLYRLRCLNSRTLVLNLLLAMPELEECESKSGVKIIRADRNR